MKFLHVWNLEVEKKIKFEKRKENDKRMKGGEYVIIKYLKKK